jgi:hypothetical protein
MKAMIYKSRHATAFLDDEHSRCSYNVPVFVLKLVDVPGEEVLGPHDALPSGKLAVEVVLAFVMREDTGGGRWHRTPGGETMARRFLKSSPPLPQRLEDLRVGDSIPRSWLSEEANRVLDGEEPER